MSISPLVSVIIVTWNSKRYLPTCLDALLEQSNKDFEIVIMDNGSIDEGYLDLEEKYSDLKPVIKKLNENLGFAVANNIGARLARGKWIVLLNADAYPEPDWLGNLLKAAEQNPNFNFFTSRQLQYNEPHLLDGTGDEYHVSGLAWRRHYNGLAAQYGHQQEEVFSACACAAMYKREDFLKVGGFDKDYFSYFEDVDLSFRLRLVGGRCLYVPQAVVYHVGSASTGKGGDFSFFYGHRNLVWTFFKDMPGWLFWLYLPFHLMMNVYLSLAFLIRDKRSVVLRSKLDAFRRLPKVFQKRRQVQRTRTVKVGEIYRIMTRDLLAPRYASRLRARKDRLDT